MMKKIFFFIGVLMIGIVNAQVLTPFHAIQKQPKVQFDYWVFSTGAGSGLTNQYPVVAASKSDMDNIFSTANSNTTLYQSGRTNSSKILDWAAVSDLSAIGINLPNSGTYFAFKIQGTFIPQETGTYTFTLESDDASDFFIEGSSVIGTYSGQALPALGTQTGTISLVAGKSYSYTIRMQQGGGGFGLRLYWKAPTQSAAIATGYTTNWSQNLQELVSSPDMDGTTSAKAAPNAQYIQTAFNNTTDGVYWINLPVVGPTQIYCILNNAVDGGGWMMMMKATTGTTFQYSSTHWTTISTLNPTDNTRTNNADAKFNTMNYYAAKDIMALWPDISTVGGSMSLGSPYSCWSWLQDNFNNGVRITPINFFNSVNRLFLKDATTYSGFSTSYFSSQTSVRFYGFNYQNTASPATAKVRWGFGFNENAPLALFPNGDESSNDVTGGIGITGTFTNATNYSAGDYFGCCGTSGINRSARVEIYIR